MGTPRLDLAGRLNPGYIVDKESASLLQCIADEIERTKTLQQLGESRRDSTSVDYEEIVTSFLAAYTRNIGHNPTDAKPDFAKAYNSLINSTESGVFDQLLKLERSYAHVVEELFASREKEIAIMQARHAQEVDQAANGKDERDLQSVYEDQLEETQVVLATWDSQIEELHKVQQQEYHDFVLELYSESRRNIGSSASHQAQSTSAAVSPAVPKADIISAAIRKLHKSPSVELLSLESADKEKAEQPNLTMSPPSSEPYKEPADPIMTRLIKELTDMGFSEEQSEAALTLTHRQLEPAINMLLENSPAISEYISQKKKAVVSSEASPSGKATLRKSPSFLQQLKALSSSPSSPKVARRSFTPRNIWADAEEATTPSGSSTPKKVSNLFQRLSSWKSEDFSKALPAESIEEPELSESFTTYFGTQVKTMYNMQLRVSNMDATFDFPRDSAQALAYRAQTASSLYSQSLSGAIILVSRKDLLNYGNQKTANAALFERCRRSTEFHFESIATQIGHIKLELSANATGKLDLEEGDFFITRHSNLPLLHVIFHLVVNDVSEPLTSRSPVLAGYRSILSTAYHYDVHNLTVPVLLSSSQVRVAGGSDATLTEATAEKRAEAVLKSTKGFIVETSRMAKHSGDSSGVERFPRTLVFVLPNDLQNARHVFGAVRERLAEIFVTE
ncbi:hypothetical protein BC832DRAFT_590474 [Gaertneriomyces semiglobifer]|nr:hypothetical protein BC832DRAFT_590474 [Gaertneriomyces semiglobifer]